MSQRPDIVLILTDEERAAPPYEPPEVQTWRAEALPGCRWFDEHAVSFDRHYTGSLACVPSRPTLFTGQYPDVHGVTQTDGLGKLADDGRMRWLRPGEVPTLGNWFEAAGYDTHYDGKWHITHADLMRNGEPLKTVDADGTIDDDAVAAYLDADPLAPFGFHGWVGPEPHGGLFENSGYVRDPIIADRVCAWLEARYAARAAGDDAAMRPFLLVASFVNPHDIVLFPAWLRRGIPTDGDGSHPPPVPPSPTDDADLADRPRVQAAYRDAYVTAYGPRELVAPAYADHLQQYRDFYYRLHAEVDGSIDRVRRAVDAGAHDSLIVRTSDHGELLGSHGGLHQKWFTLYEEATRVPFQVAGVGSVMLEPRRVTDMPTTHVDLVPTLLGAAGVDVASIEAALAERFAEVHPLPGRDLMPVVRGNAPIDPERPVYAMTRDHILEGDTGLSAAGRALGDSTMTVDVLPNVATNVEGIVARAPDGALWKLVRTFDDAANWTEPFEAQLTSEGVRTEELSDEYELYDLSTDPAETTNRATDTDAAAVLGFMLGLLAAERTRCLPARNALWPYAKLAPRS